MLIFLYHLVTGMTVLGFIVIGIAVIVLTKGLIIPVLVIGWGAGWIWNNLIWKNEDRNDPF